MGSDFYPTIVYGFKLKEPHYKTVREERVEKRFDSRTGKEIRPETVWYHGIVIFGKEYEYNYEETYEKISDDFGLDVVKIPTLVMGVNFEVEDLDGGYTYNFKLDSASKLVEFEKEAKQKLKEFAKKFNIELPPCKLFIGVYLSC